MRAFRPLEATARASAQIPATYRANPIRPLSVYLKVYLNLTAMREYEFAAMFTNMYGELPCRPARAFMEKRFDVHHLLSILGMGFVLW